MFDTGYVIGVIAAAIAVIVPGIGSALSVSKAGQTVAGLTAEQPKSFFRAFTLSLLPATQGLYGFVVAIIISGQLAKDMSVADGWALFFAALPVAIVGLFSAIYQSNAARAGIQLLGKQPKSMGKGLMMAGIVETYALFAFVVSIFLVGA